MSHCNPSLRSKLNIIALKKGTEPLLSGTETLMPLMSARPLMDARTKPLSELTRNTTTIVILKAML